MFVYVVWAIALLGFAIICVEAGRRWEQSEWEMVANSGIACVRRGKLFFVLSEPEYVTLKNRANRPPPPPVVIKEEPKRRRVAIIGRRGKK